jgi:hypothetical protein
MNITEYTPAGTWPTDDILVSETIKTLDATPDQADFTYTITVGTHGDYPTEQVIEDPVYTISGVEDEGSANAWTYYVNQLHEADNFIADLIAAVDARGEDTVIVMFGDHLPTMGLENEDMLSGDIYKTKYITWNNMNLPKEDADLYAYQLLASVTDSVGIHEGTVLGFHQTQNYEVSEEYEAELENLQYDILYGNRYCYNGADAYPATDIVMGIDDVTIKAVRSSYDGSRIYINGSGFTKWSKVYINGEKVSATYVSGNQLTISPSKIADGDTVQICQVGSNNTVFRSSQEWIYEDPNAEVDTETEEMEPEEQQGEL